MKKITKRQLVAQCCIVLPWLAFCAVILPAIYVQPALLPDNIKDADDLRSYDVPHEPKTPHLNSSVPPPLTKHEVCLFDQSHSSGINQENVCLYMSPRFVSLKHARSECHVKSDHVKKSHRTKSHIVELQYKPPVLDLLERFRALQSNNRGTISGAAWLMHKGNVSAILISNATYYHTDSELNGYTTLLADINLPVLCLEREVHHHKKHHSRWNWKRLGHLHKNNKDTEKSSDADSTTHSSTSNDAHVEHSPSTVSQLTTVTLLSHSTEPPVVKTPEILPVNKPRVKRAVHYKVTRQNVAAKKVAAAQPEFDDDGEEEEDIPEAAPPTAKRSSAAKVEFDDWEGVDTNEMKPQADFDASEASVIVKYKDDFDADEEEEGEEQNEEMPAEKKKKVVASKKVKPQQPYKIKYFKSFDEDDEENMEEAAAPPAPVVEEAPAPKAAPVKKEKPAAAKQPAAADSAAKTAAKPAVEKKPAAKPAAAKPAAVKPAAKPAAKAQFSVGDDESKQDHDEAPNDPDEWKPPAKASAAFVGAAKPAPAGKRAPVAPSAAKPVAVVVAMANKPHLDDVVAPPAQAAAAPAPEPKPADVIVPPQPAAAAVQLAAANEMTAYDRKTDRSARKSAKQAKHAQKKAAKAAKKTKPKRGRHHKPSPSNSADAEAAPEVLKVVAKAAPVINPDFDEKDDKDAPPPPAADKDAPPPQVAEKAASDAAAQSSDAAEKAADAAGSAQKAAASSEKAADAAAAAGADAAEGGEETKKKKKKKKRKGLHIGNPFKGRKTKGADGKKYTVYQVPIAKIANMQENSMDRLFGTPKVTLRNALEQLPEPLQNAETHDDFTARAIMTHIVARYYRNYNERDIHEIAKRLFRDILSRGKPRQCFKADEANTYEPVACLSPDGPVDTCLKQDFQNGTLRRGCGVPNKGMSVMKGSCNKDKHGFVKCACDRDLCNSALPTGSRGQNQAYFVFMEIVVAMLVAMAAATGATCSTELMQYFA